MPKLNLPIVQGKTFQRTLRWGALPYLYRPITAISKTAPARITATGHAIPDGWPVAVVSVQGMREINAANSPPRPRDFVRITVVDVNTIDLNAVNASEFTAYTSGGYLQAYSPVSLAACVARMTLRDRVGGTSLLALDSALLGGIVLDDTAKTITVMITATQTAAFTWTSAVYDLEIQDGLGNVTLLTSGNVTVTKEITT